MCSQLMQRCVQANLGCSTSKDPTYISLLDLREVYLQIHIHERLLSYQTVVFHGRKYSVTRLGFGLNIALQVIKSIIETMMSQDEAINIDLIFMAHQHLRQ